MKTDKKLLFIFILLFTVTTAAEQIEGKVVKVLDGDTVQVLDSAKNNYRVRLYGIDAPEKNQAWGQNAKKALSRAIASKNVVVVINGVDIYKRTLGTIWLDGYNMNGSMVSSGHAWVYRNQGQPTVPAYLPYEKQAQQANSGLWSESSPIPPWVWRQQEKNKQE